jgi:hypothetical protein
MSKIREFLMISWESEHPHASAGMIGSEHLAPVIVSDRVNGA